jgi:AcrR family transcriptional regulator
VEQCLRLLTRLVDQGPDEILEQLWRVFYNLRPADLQRAREFIAALLAHPTWSRTDPLFVYLEEALIVWPVETFEVLEILLAKYDEGIAAGEPTMASFSEVPLQIVTFILQSYPDREIRALDALDELIAMRWKGIREFLQATSSL